MIFLFGQIATCLLLAFFVGFLLGWLVRERSHGDHVTDPYGPADGYIELMSDAERRRRSSSSLQSVIGEVD